jgi:uncharacterized membrane protein
MVAAAVPGSSEPAQEVEIRKLEMADVGWALRKGWGDFLAHRGDLLFLPVIYPFVGFLLSALAFQRSLFLLIFPLAAGFALVGPIAAAGFYELARRRESGEPSGWRHFLDPMRGRARWSLLALAGMLVILFLTWISAASILYGETMGKLRIEGAQPFIQALFSTAEGWRMIVIGNLMGAGFALAALVVSAFSFPMVVDKAVDPLTACLTSLRVFLKNPAVVLAWGFCVALILLIASIPLFVGLMVALPVLGYATWHFYTRAVAR